MTESFKICAIGIAFAIVCVLIKSYSREFLIPVRVASTLLIFGVVIALVSPTVKYLNTIIGQTLPLEYVEIIFKALAIAYMTQISSELSMECGENSIARGIEIVGKLEMVILTLPLIDDVISMSGELLQW